MVILFLFLDGVGLGKDDPGSNPFARAKLPNLQYLLEGRKLLDTSVPFNGIRASLLALDASLGVEGLPQSATGQAVLLTGVNIPAEIGYHYGPKPNPDVAQHLQNGNLFSWLNEAGKRAALLNAYPEGYFAAINSGRRIYSSIPMAVNHAGLPLFTADDLYSGRALSADFTGQGWRDRLGYMDAPIYTPVEAGKRLANLARRYDFSLFEYWPTDYAGHGQEMATSSALLEQFDAVLGGLLAEWHDTDGLILITSDHGNIEDLSTRRHTANQVPLILVGSSELRKEFTAGLVDLTGIAPRIQQFLQ